jgi:hypothetical protein
MFGLTVIIALALACLPGIAFSQQRSLKEQLVGTWTLVSWEEMNKEGTKVQRFGANPKGVHVFDANGHFFTMFARPELPKIASNNPSNPTPEEAKAIVTGSIAYFGTYTVDEAEKTISLRIESSTFPNQLGMEQKRKITTITADELKYTNVTTVAGNPIDIAFKRAK